QPVTHALFSADGQHLLTAASADGEIIMRLWNPRAGQSTSSPLEASPGISRYLFSPDGRYLAAVNSPPILRRVGAQATLWETSTARRILPTMEHSLPIMSLSFRLDGRCLATASLDQTVRLWSVTGGQQLMPPLKHGDFADQVAFHPDGHRLLSASYDGTARLWETAIKPLVTLHHGGPIYWATFSPDGQRV